VEGIDKVLRSSRAEVAATATATATATAAAAAAVTTTAATSATASTAALQHCWLLAGFQCSSRLPQSIW